MNKTTVYESWCNCKLVSYLVLHDKLGFGVKRIDRLESTIGKYLDDFIQSDDYADDFFDKQLRKKGIYVHEIVAKIPARVRLKLTFGKKIPKKLGKENLSDIGGSLRAFLEIALYVLIKEFKLTHSQLNEYLSWMQFNFECLADKNRLTIEDIVPVLEKECGYLDPRYIIKN